MTLSPARTAQSRPAPRAAAGYCPDCLRVVSPRETTCRHCGCVYGVRSADRVIALAAWAVWMVALSALAVLWW